MRVESPPKPYLTILQDNFPTVTKEDVERQLELRSEAQTTEDRVSADDLLHTTTVLVFAKDDLGNPYNWSQVYRTPIDARPLDADMQ